MSVRTLPLALLGLLLAPLPALAGFDSQSAGNVACSGCVGSTDLASDSVTAAKIATGEVGADEIATGAVGADELAATAVSSGTYASPSSVTVDADGRITAITAGSGATNYLAIPPRNYVGVDHSATTLTAVGLPAITITGNSGTPSYSQTTDTLVISSTAVANAEVLIYSSQTVARRRAASTNAPTSTYTTDTFMPTATANERYWILAVTSNVTTLADNDLPTGIHYCGIRYSTAASDTQWQCCSADGSAAGCTALGNRTDGVWRRFQIAMSSASCVCRQIDTSGTVLDTATRSSNLPGTGTALNLGSFVTPLTGSSIETRVNNLGISY